VNITKIEIKYLLAKTIAIISYVVSGAMDGAARDSRPWMGVGAKNISDDCYC